MKIMCVLAGRGVLPVLFFLLPVFAIAGGKGSIVADKEEARKAYVLLNDIRVNPEDYCRELHFSRREDVSRMPLRWNDTLARIAEAKAIDMARRDYFDHVDPDGYGMNYLLNKGGYRLNREWLQDKRRNSFESIGMGWPGGEEAIRALIIDQGVPSLGHRKHLLGLGEWNSSLKDIGIGYVTRGSGSDYETYICVVIAKHDW
jgi:hypothetical protein